MRTPAEFREAIRTGVRGKSVSLMVHVAQPSGVEADQPPLVGFVVPKSVGNAVVRNRIERQLRHLMRERLDNLADGTYTVIRVFPQARGKTSTELGKDLDRALEKCR